MKDPMHTKTLALARAKAQLLDVSPRERGMQKQTQALDWIYRWGWSSATIVDSLSGTTGRGLSSRLIKNKLLKRTRTESGGGVQGVPNYILTLTKAGLQIVERDREKLLLYNTDSTSISAHKMRHDYLAQSLTLTMQKNLPGFYFKTEKEFAKFSEKHIKQPDIIWASCEKNCKGTGEIAVEIELSRKWDRDLDHFIHSCLLLLAQKKADLIFIISDSQAIIDAYEKAFEPGMTYSRYEKGNNRWDIAETYPILPWSKGKIKFSNVMDFNPFHRERKREEIKNDDEYEIDDDDDLEIDTDLD
jgi:hypothetical protein